MQRVRRQGRGRKVGSAGSNRKVAVVTGDTDGLEPSQTAGLRASRQSRIRKEPAMQGSTFVGLDVHKRWINVAVLLPGSDPHRVADLQRTGRDPQDAQANRWSEPGRCPLLL
jgi:hypothetical protein